MGELRLPGLATGIDTATLIQQLMIINSRRLANYQVQKTDYETKTTALDELRTVITAMLSSVNALSNADNLQTFNTSSSDTDILTVAATSNAGQGSHSVEINQLATTETWIHDVSTFDYETDYVGGGTFIFSYNNQEATITTVANVTTLEDMVNLINNDDNNPGVTASLLYQGGKYHLMLSGQETGEDYQISINASSTEVWESSTEGGSFTKDGETASLSTKIIELTEFSGSFDVVDSAFIRISGKDHAGTDLSDLDLYITAETTVGHLIDSINESFDGVATAEYVNGEIRLTDNLYGTSLMEVYLTYDQGTGTTDLTLPAMTSSTTGGSIVADLTGFEANTFLETQDAQSSEIKIDGYPAGSGIAEVQTLSGAAKATGGTFTLTYDGQTTASISRNASTAQIQAALEALSNVEVGDITVSGNKLDNNNPTMVFTFLGSAGDVGMISIDTTNLTPSSGWTFSETTKGDSTGVWLIRNSNSISDALTGVTLNLRDVTTEPIEITITRNTSAVGSKVQSMVEAYNSLITFINEKTEYDSETKEMGILSNNMGISFIESQLRNEFIGIVDGFTDTIDSFVQASDIGITFAGDGTMELDISEFNDAIGQEKGFENVLELLGAIATGSSDGGVVEFYSASGDYTTAGTYNIKVVITGNQITEAYIKLAGESTYRTCTWDGNLIKGNNTFDEDGSGPLYPENSLYLTVKNLTNNGTFGTDETPLVVRVKQGLAGALEDILDSILEVDGQLDISEAMLEDRITKMETIIEREEARLENIQTRLIRKYARLEKTLILLQQQLSAISTFSIGASL